MSTFTNEEKIAFKKICSISTKDKTTVRDVLFAILTYAGMEAFKEDNEIIIPYLCKLKLNYKEIINEKGIESIIDVEGEPSSLLLKEFACIKNDEKPFTKKYFEKQNRLHFKNLLKIKDLTE